jgi:hypothetical protein
VLSANLLNGGADPDAFADLVASLDVDVLAVQEVGHAQAEALLDLFESGEIIPAPDFTGMGLLARHDLEVERIPLSWGFGQIGGLRLAGWGDDAPVVELTNLHIAAPHMWSPRPGPWLRYRQAAELDSHLRHGAQKRCVSTNSSSATKVRSGEGAPERPGIDSEPRKWDSERLEATNERAGRERKGPARIVVGDFNATPYWPWYRRMVSQFTDVAVAVADKTGESPRSTWGPWPGSRRLLRIDHGFVHGIEPEAFEVVDIVGSDHSAIVMDLSFGVSGGRSDGDADS